MGKIYIDTVKYVIRADIEIVGLVEKPDVVGAIFGQTEGLLGEELDLRELQKNGRIGRIEVNMQARGGKSVGTIEIPSSLDIIETSVIAAALESVDRVGPCEAKITVTRIEDTRNVKRKKIIDRAKDLVKKLLTTEIPERKEITEAVRSEVRTAEISTYGPEKLPSGPNLDSYDSIIIVEGRADVINLLKNDINNVIAVGGATAAQVPRSIIDLCKRKEVTMFVDGDRGGDIIFKEVSAAAEVDFLAKAPPGREVEELSRKEILKALRSRVPVEQIEIGHKKEESRESREEREERHEARESRSPRGTTFETKKAILPSAESLSKSIEQMIERRETFESVREKGVREKRIGERGSDRGVMPPEIAAILSQIDGTLNARIYDENMTLLKEVPVRDVTKELDVPGAYAVILDGIITQRLVDIAESKAIKVIAGIRIGNIFRRPEGLSLWAKELP
jgi:DNA primase